MDKKQQIINLWRVCFHDPDTFIDLFFDRVYRDENALILEKQGLVASALQLLPYTMTYYGTEIQAGYIYGACTAPAYRGQGLMRQLLHEAFEVMKSRDIALATLIPSDLSLFDYYRENGFAEAFDYTEDTYVRSRYPVQAPLLTVVPPEVPSMKLLYAYFDRKLRERPCCMLHSYEDFVTILRDLQLGGGQMLTALNIEDQIVGMIFLAPSSDGMYAKEILFDTPQVKELLLQEAAAQHEQIRLRYRTPPTLPSMRSFGMARILDTPRLIRHWLSVHPDGPDTESDLQAMDIPALTQHLLDYPHRQAYMSLMLD